ncbi:NifU family protein [Frigoriflavimonas asaccharolytica]|uniref:Fe-S cluster biogenesis protein NfuA n=1 Tax=Frigoriflavimonas asaccharolytica TaxID=2735899 RepID=A0A8J8GDM4_9FLAO|nr:NifU family protein [Frigoriflavimonas asaccharolytica]NRS94015.1 Fe-S cluster biogenesis protein NfuA [Frigoriflavimonas asaccharolytica]
MQNIIIEPTENPKVMKFVTDYQIIPGSIELDRQSDVSEMPLAKELFNFNFIEKIFITSNFIAISKKEDVKWEFLVESLKDVIQEQLEKNPRIYIQKQAKTNNVFAEMTPNPSVMKFVSSTNLLSGFVEVKNKENSDDVPLAKAIFEEFSFVKEVFISDNFVAVTKDESVEWHKVMIEMRAFITEYLQNGGKISNLVAQNHAAPVEQIMNRNYTETEQRISDILVEYVAPAVENDGGKISLMEYVADTKTAKMLLQGACSGCPSSTATLKNGIENILKQFLPEVVENVEAVNG